MKTKRHFFLAITLFIAICTSTVMADITKTVGIANADFTTLGAAFTAINANTGGLYTGVVTLQIIDNTTEAAAAVLYGSQSLSATAPTKVSGGSGYTCPSLVFGGGGTGASGTFTIGATSLASIKLVNGGGFGYTSVPVVTITGTGGTGASAVAKMTTPVSITGGTKTAGGSGFQTPPTLTFIDNAGGTGSGATATVTLSATTIASYVVTSGGTGYTSVPTVVLTGGGFKTAATATASISSDGSVTSIAVTTAGDSYTTPPVVSFTGGGGSGAAATALLTATSLNAVTVTSAGSGYTSPAIVITPVVGGTGATLTPTFASNSIASVIVTNGGTGFTSMPVATIGLSQSIADGASATATTTVAPTSMNTVTIVNRGSGYINPTLTISDPAGTGASYTMPAASTIAYSAVNIYPTVTGKTVSSSAGIYNITLTGASNVFIDGRLYDTSGNLMNGNTRDLTISNTNAGGTGTGVLQFTGNASNNTVSYCKLLGATNTYLNGMIWFNSGSVPTGNSNNTVSYNLISNSGTRPAWAIYSNGTPGSPNTGNKISNNEFKDILHSTSYGTGYIYIFGSQTNDWMNTAWTISDNSFYETTPVIVAGGSSSISGIKLGSDNGYLAGTNNVITNNYIGGSQAQCGGTPWSKTNVYGVANACNLMYFNFNAGGSNLIQNNVISNISYTTYFNTNGSNYYMNGINLNGGNAVIDGNTVGAKTGNGSLYYRVQHCVNNSVLSASGGTFTGISIGANCLGTVECKNNTVGSIKMETSLHKASMNFTGISRSAVTGLTTIHDNTVGNATIPNSIDMQANDTVMATNGDNNKVTGIYYYGMDANGAVDHNTIANITNRSTNNNTGATGITIGISTGGGNITNNDIHDITAGNANNADGYYAPAAMNGIMHANALPLNATGNTIHDLSITFPGFTGAVQGIYMQNTGVNVSTNTVSGNLIYGLKTDPTSTGARIRGIFYHKCPNVINNNIIALSAGTNAAVNGIYEAAAMASTAYSLTMCYNTVYISGTATTGAAGSYCSSLNTVNTTRTIKNNIFVNASVNTAATGKHIALFVKQTGTIDLNYNDYYATGSGAKSIMASNGTDCTTLAAWHTAVGAVLDAKTVSVDPGFANPAGTLGTDFMTSSLSLVGTPVTGITTDFSNTARNTSVPTMGALENPEIGKITAVQPVQKSNIKVIVNEAGVAVLLDAESNVELYNVNGILIEKTRTSGLYTHSLNHGMYVIRINDQVTKFVK